MKIIKILFVTIGLFFFVSSCNSNSKAKSKADTWNKGQKEQWTSKCLTFLEANGVEKKNAVDYCSCVLEKTSEKYTPAEAANITEEEERKLWDSCDYSW